MSAEPKPRVFVVDDHPVFSELLAELLHESGDFVVVGTARDGETALIQLAATKVDLLVLDLVLPGLSGIEVLERLRFERNAVRTVVYTGMDSDELISSVLARGACAVVQKNAQVTDLLEVLRAVSRGEFPATSRMSGALRAMVRQRAVSKELGATGLSILRRLAERHTPKEIAAEFNLSVSTVYKTRMRIMRRMGLTSRSGFSQAASSLGLILNSPGMVIPVAARGHRSDRKEASP